MKTRNHLKTPNSKDYEYIYSIHSSELEVQAIDIKSTVIFYNISNFKSMFKQNFLGWLTTTYKVTQYH